MAIYANREILNEKSKLFKKIEDMTPEEKRKV